MVAESLFKKVAFPPKREGWIWGKSVPGRENSKSEDLDAGTGLAQHTGGSEKSQCGWNVVEEGYEMS